VLSPNALGAILDDQSIAALRAPIVAAAPTTSSPGPNMARH
jgi:hypothetical protein